MSNQPQQRQTTPTGDDAQPSGAPVVVAAPTNNNGGRNSKRQKTNDDPANGANAKGGGANRARPPPPAPPQQQQPQQATVEEKMQLMGARMAKASEICGSRAINPHITECHFNNFYRFASCMDRLMYTATWGMVLGLQTPDEVPMRTRAFLQDHFTKTYESTPPLLHDLMQILSIADADVMNTQWEPLAGTPWPKAKRTAEELQRLQVITLDVLATDDLEDGCLPNSHASPQLGGWTLLSTPPSPSACNPYGGQDGAAGGSNDAVTTNTSPANDTSPPLLPPVEKLRFVSMYDASHVYDGARDLGFGFAEEAVVEDRDCYLNSFRYITCVLLHHEFFRLASEDDARRALAAIEHKAATLVGEGEEDGAAAAGVRLRDWVSKELERLISEGQAAEAQLLALQTDDVNTETARVQESIRAIKLSIEETKAELARRVGPSKPNAPPGGDSMEQDGDAEYLQELHENLERLNRVFARRLDALQKRLQEQQDTLMTLMEKSGGQTQEINRLRVQTGRGAAAAAAACCEKKIRDITEMIARRIRFYARRYVERFQRFTHLVGPRARELAKILRGLMSYKELALDSRMAIFRATQRHFARVSGDGAATAPTTLTMTAAAATMTTTTTTTTTATMTAGPPAPPPPPN